VHLLVCILQHCHKLSLLLIPLGVRFRRCPFSCSLNRPPLASSAIENAAGFMSRNNRECRHKGNISETNEISWLVLLLHHLCKSNVSFQQNPQLSAVTPATSEIRGRRGKPSHLKFVTKKHGQTLCKMSMIFYRSEPILHKVKFWYCIVTNIRLIDLINRS